MGTTKVTFTLDEATLTRLQLAAERLAKPKSQVVREAIKEYYERTDRLTEEERLRMLRVFDEMLAKIPPRPQAEIDKELREIRRARRAWGRKTPQSL